MKKLTFLSLMVASALTFQACSSNSGRETDSVEQAEDANDNNGNAAGDDSEFMVEAADGGMMEVEAGKIAQTNGSSQAVKDFGARMVADHTKANEELKAIAAAKNVALPAVPGEDMQKHLEEMRKLQGTEFDKHYIDMMVNDHDKTVRMFEEAEKDGKDADVRAFAAKTLPVLREHQAAAKSLDGSK